MYISRNLWLKLFCLESVSEPCIIIKTKLIYYNIPQYSCKCVMFIYYLESKFNLVDFEKGAATFEFIWFQIISMPTPEGIFLETPTPFESPVQAHSSF